MKQHITKFSSLALTALAAIAFLACSQENEEDRKIAAALACLDAAKTMADSDICQSKVSGMETEQAYLIRCSANFIAQGITGSTLASAFSQLNKTPATGSQTSSMLSFLVFTKTSALNTSALTMSNCAKSGVQSSKGLAAMVSAASAIAATCPLAICPTGLAGSPLDPASPSFNADQLRSLASTLAGGGDTATKDTIGQAAVAAQAAICGTGSSLSGEDVCKKINAAIAAGAGNTVTIGQNLLNAILSP